MHHGLRLTGTDRDVAALHAVANGFPALVQVPWVQIRAAGAPGLLLLCPRLDAATAAILATRGLDAVRVTVQGDACTIDPLRPDATRATWKSFQGRNASNLIEALPPLKLRGDPLSEDACFWVPVESPGAQQTIERLLALGRDDVSVGELTENGQRMLIVRCPTPPMYLLLRLREEPDEGVVAYTRTEGEIWVEWGYEHPLAAAAAKLLANAGSAAFVGASGQWRFLKTPWPARTVYDAVMPELKAVRTDLQPAEGTTRFTIHLRLGAGPEGVPELWLLTAKRFADLETLIENATSEELSRLTVARLTGPEGTVYYLREIVRPGISRLGMRVSDMTGLRGFSRASGTDNLYLPVGRRLLPVVRRDELRALLSLDQAHVVVVDEDRDGPRVLSIGGVDEVPLANWVDYVAMDRRMELDRLLESATMAAT